MKRGTSRIALVIFALLFCAASIDTFAENAHVAWITKYKGGGEVVDLSTDAAGNVYVTGTTKGQSQDFVTIKYNSSGKQQWAGRDGIAGRQDTPSALKVDATGNVYVTGSSDGGASAFDFLTVKYKASGGREWTARYNNTENNSDFANDIAVDRSGNVYVTGGSRSSTTGYDYLTLKYNSAGSQQWAARYVGPGILPGDMDDFSRFIELDSAGNIYVTGTIETGSIDILTIKYNSSGQALWAMRYDHSAHSIDEPSGLAIDKAGNVYVAGNSQGSNSDFDIILIKYTSSGKQQWVKRYSSSGRYPEDTQDMFLGEDGSVYVTGSTNDHGNNNFVTLKYASTGARKWTALYDYAKYSDGAYSVDVDHAGNVYVTGNGQSQSLSNDIITLKYDAQGHRQWVVHYSSSVHFDRGRTIALDPSNGVIVAGDSLNAGWVTIKYIQEP